MKDVQKMRKIIVLAALIIFIGIFGASCTQKDDKSINIGAVLPLTGKFAYYGDLSQKAIQLAVENLKSEGYNINYYFKDSQSSVQKGISSAKMLINTKNVDALATSPSPLCLATNHILVNKDIVHIAYSAHPDVLNTKANTIRAFLSADDDIHTLAQYLNSNNNLDDLFVFVINDDYGHGLFEALKKYSKNKSIKKVFLDFGQKDFKNLLLSNNVNKYDATIILAYGSSVTANLLLQSYSLFDNIQIYGNSNFANNPIKKLDNSIKDQLIFSSTPIDLGIYNDKAQFVSDQYEKKYDESISLSQAFTYDSIVNFIKYYNTAKNKDASSPREMYSEIFDPGHGVIGKFTYDETGNIHSETKMATYREGKIVALDDIE